MEKTMNTGLAGSLRVRSLIMACTLALAGVAFPTCAEVVTTEQGEGPRLEQADRLAADALSLLEQNRLDEASTKINQALQLQVRKSYFHLINGLIYHLQAMSGGKGSYELANQGYDQAIQFDRSNWLAYYFSGILAAQEQKFETARERLGEALQLRKDDHGLLNAFAYAAYRAGSPDLAAGAVTALEMAGGIRSKREIRNAAMIMAAVGEKDSADRYLSRLSALGDKDIGSLTRRTEDWSDVHRQARLIKVADGWSAPAAPAAAGSWRAPAAAAPAAAGSWSAPAAAAPAAADGWGAAAAPAGAGWGAAAPAVVAPAAWGATPAPAFGAAAYLGAPVPVNSPDKMVVVDVVMIGTEETMATTAGINLLSGLSIQFGSSTTPAYSRAFNRSLTRTGAADGTTADTSSISNTITRALSIPGIAYTLNIANNNSGRSEILTRPTLVATSGKLSEFFSGTELNAVAAASGSAGGAPINIQKEIGVKLSVLPMFLPDGRLSLQVNALRTFLKTPSKDVIFDSKLETTKVSVSANVVMRYGETLILGGLNEKSTEIDRDGVPLLQDIPAIQYLFSKKQRAVYQNSLLILITPRAPQFVYQSEKAREEYEKSLSEDDRQVASLRARYSDWFKPYPNWASVFNRLQDNALYREFRTGDVTLESWSGGSTLKERLSEIAHFLYY
jgi:tetratricopeptide (TPR) repeat protein